MKYHLCFAAVLFICLTLSGHSVWAGEGEPSIARTLDKNQKKSSVTFSLDNDLLASGSDQYYTNGIQLTYYSVDRRPPPIIDTFLDDVLGYDIGVATSTTYFLGQKMFTPKDIKLAAAQPDDRPWAGWLYGGFLMSNIYPTYSDRLGVTVGVVGPLSMAEQAQKFIHKNVSHSPRPRGWNNQLKNEPGLVLTWDRRWQNFAGQNIGQYRAQLEPNVSVALGNISTYGGAGLNLTFGPAQNEFRDVPPRIYPAMLGSGYFDRPASRDWDWYTFAGVNGRAIARDIFLDGNSFSSGPSIDKKEFVYDGNVGVAFTYLDTRLSYSLTYRSKEFEGQDDATVFGSVGVSYRF